MSLGADVLKARSRQISYGVNDFGNAARSGAKSYTSMSASVSQCLRL